MKKIDDDTFEWGEIYRIWLCSCQRINSKINEIQFIEPFVSKQPSYSGIQCRDEFFFGNLSQANNQKKIASTVDEKGPCLTAHYLNLYADNPEHKAAVWIHSSLVGITRNLPESWRGRSYGHIRTVEKAIRESGIDVPSYHHASVGLPIQIVPRYRIFQNPETVFSLLDIVAIECSVNHSNYSIIKIKFDDTEFDNLGKFTPFIVKSTEQTDDRI